MLCNLVLLVFTWNLYNLWKYLDIQIFYLETGVYWKLIVLVEFEIHAFLFSYVFWHIHMSHTIDIHYIGQKLISVNVYCYLYARLKIKLFVLLYRYLYLLFILYLCCSDIHPMVVRLHTWFISFFCPWEYISYDNQMFWKKKHSCQCPQWYFL